MYWRAISSRVKILGIVLIAVLGLAYYLLLGRITQATVTDQLLYRERIFARAEASNISSFFRQFGKSIAVFSELGSITHPDSNTYSDMDVFISQWSENDLVGGIVLTDENGIVKYNSNVSGTRDTGASLADRDYFVWAKEQGKPGEYYVGLQVISRLGASKNQFIVPVASPVFRDGEFKGIVSSSVLLDKITNRYLDMMKISDATEVYLVDQLGVILYGPTEDVLRVNIFESERQHPFLGNRAAIELIKKSLESKEGGNLVTTYASPVIGETQLRLVAFSLVLLRNKHWMVIVSSPMSDVLDLTALFHSRQVAVLVFSILAVLAFGVVIVREMISQNTRSNRS